MSIVPLQLARVSNLLRTSTAQSQIASTEQDLLTTQNELSTGHRINAPSDDPGSAAVVMQLQKTLEQRGAYAGNLKQGQSQLSEVDTSLGDLTDLVQRAQTIASSDVGSDVTDSQRKADADIIQSVYNQVLSIANKQFAGTYIFGGDKSTDPPFVSTNGGAQFVGSNTVLQNADDENANLPFMVSAGDVFGALSSRVQGNVDLTPSLTAQTRITDLRGAGGTGVHLGTVLLGNGTTTRLVDLSKADTVGDVANTITAAGLGNISAALAPGGGGLQLTTTGGDNITVQDVGGGTTAADLGILKPTGGGAAPVAGSAIRPAVTPLTTLASLKGGAGIDQTHGLLITGGTKTVAIDLSAAHTVEDLLNAVNGSGTGVLARINAAGNGIDFVNSTQGTQMTVAENGGTTAADLGVRTFGPATPLSELNGGKGVRTVAGADFQITNTAGATFQVDLGSGQQTIQDVIDAINTGAITAGVTGITASFAPTGNGITINDTAAGAGQLALTPLNFSSAAADLGLTAAPASATKIAGGDVNSVAADGVFSNLARLRDALQSNDQAGITAAGGALQGDHDRIVNTRGQTGARVQEMQSRQSRLDDENIATKSMLSSLQDTDFTEAITKFQTLQNSLQATLQTTAKVLNLSLLDFLG